MTARQVFPWSTEEESGKELLTTSNVLWLDVNADPGWQRRDLAKIMLDYGTHQTVSCRELSALDVPEATTEKLKLLDHSDSCRMSFNPPEYETARRTIEQWIHDPNHAVTETAIDALTTVRSSMSHRELLTGLPDDPEKAQAIGRAWITALETSKTALAKEICTTFAKKSRSAQVSTKKSMCEVLRWQPPVEDTTCGCRDTSRR